MALHVFAERTKVFSLTLTYKRKIFIGHIDRYVCVFLFILYIYYCSVRSEHRSVVIKKTRTKLLGSLVLKSQPPPPLPLSLSVFPFAHCYEAALPTSSKVLEEVGEIQRPEKFGCTGLRLCQELSRNWAVLQFKMLKLSRRMRSCLLRNPKCQVWIYWVRVDRFYTVYPVHDLQKMLVSEGSSIENKLGHLKRWSPAVIFQEHWLPGSWDLSLYSICFMTISFSRTLER